MEFGRQAAEFERLEFHLAGVSVDAPARSAPLHEKLALPYPLLCDPEHRLVKAWDVYNPRERGGIAQPATAVVTAEGALAWFGREAMSHRVRAAELLTFLDGGSEPQPRGFGPGIRDVWRALRC